jgi:AcrR family transcriptional regulator
MSSLDTPPAKPGLRERKKQQTRETIARVALRLFAERGYDETTLADIAAAADVAPRTIFAYFEGKEDILLDAEGAFLNQLKRTLDERPSDATTVDAIRQFLDSMESPDEDARLRKRVIMANPALHGKMRARHAQVEPMLA